MEFLKHFIFFSYMSLQICWYFYFLYILRTTNLNNEKKIQCKEGYFKSGRHNETIILIVTT